MYDKIKNVTTSSSENNFSAKEFELFKIAKALNLDKLKINLLWSK